MSNPPLQDRIKLGVRDLSIHYGSEMALEGVSFDIREHEIFGIIGPANAGKTSFLKAVNRMDMFNSNMSVGGEITFNGLDISKGPQCLWTEKKDRRGFSASGGPALIDL